MYLNNMGDIIIYDMQPQLTSLPPIHNIMKILSTGCNIASCHTIYGMKEDVSGDFFFLLISSLR